MNDLRTAAYRALEAWDETILPKANDGMMQERMEALRAALEQKDEPVAWMPIATAPKGRIVLVYYKNPLGNGRTMRARYYLPETLDSDTTESGWADEGWYEESEAYEYLMPLEHEPTHWMPLPAAPDTAPQPAKRVPLTDKEIDQLWCEFPSDEFGFARAIESAVNQQWLDMLASTPGVERIMELARDWADETYNDAIVNERGGSDESESEKAEAALRTAVEQALAARVPPVPDAAAPQPPQQPAEWVRLTEADFAEASKYQVAAPYLEPTFMSGARWAERELRKKNGGGKC